MANNHDFWKYYAKYPPGKIKKCSLNDFHTLSAIMAKKILIYGALALATRPTRQNNCAKLSKNIKVKNPIV